MTSRTRVWVLAISTPVIAFALIGGYLGQAMTRDDTYQHLRVFEDVVSLVLNNYVEEVDVKKAMKGAWTPQEISDFVKNPKLMAPGTSMTFAGIPRASERADLIAFLNSKSDNPQNLTKAAQAK